MGREKLVIPYPARRFATEAGEPEDGIPGITAPWDFDPMLLHGRRWSLDASRRYCNHLARAHYENFPVLFSFLDKRKREALAAIYSFARTADDFADEGEFEGIRERLLDAWERQLGLCLKGSATHPTFVALEAARRHFDLPDDLFLDLLDAFRQDCKKKRYETFDELLDYCRRSANPVGRLVLGVFGIEQPDFKQWSDRICTALQLTNFWQDISVDLRKGRIYIPVEDLERFCVPARSLLSGCVPRSFRSLVRFEVDRTRELFRQGWPLVVKSDFPETLFFGGVWLGGRSMLRMVKDAKERILHHRPTLNFHSFSLVLTRAGLERLPMVNR